MRVLFLIIGFMGVVLSSTFAQPQNQNFGNPNYPNQYVDPNNANLNIDPNYSNQNSGNPNYPNQNWSTYPQTSQPNSAAIGPQPGYSFPTGNNQGFNGGYQYQPQSTGYSGPYQPYGYQPLATNFGVPVVQPQLTLQDIQNNILTEVSKKLDNITTQISVESRKPATKVQVNRELPSSWQILLDGVAEVLKINQLTTLPDEFDQIKNEAQASNNTFMTRIFNFVERIIKFIRVVLNFVTVGLSERVLRFVHNLLFSHSGREFTAL